MATFQTFAAELKVATRGLEPDEINAKLARFARQALAREIRSGRASPNYEKFVNGRKGAEEETVQAPGPILYLFSQWREIIAFALLSLEEKSPRKSGRYVGSFFVMVNGQRVTNFATIPPTATVLITSDQPYSRKIHVGAMEGMSVPRGNFEKARQALFRKFNASEARSIDADVRFIDLPGAYVRQRGRGAGQAITYPALAIRMA